MPRFTISSQSAWHGPVVPPACTGTGSLIPGQRAARHGLALAEHTHWQLEVTGRRGASSLHTGRSLTPGRGPSPTNLNLNTATQYLIAHPRSNFPALERRTRRLLNLHAGVPDNGRTGGGAGPGTAARPRPRNPRAGRPGPQGPGCRALIVPLRSLSACPGHKWRVRSAAAPGLQRPGRGRAQKLELWRPNSPCPPFSMFFLN